MRYLKNRLIGAVTIILPLTVMLATTSAAWATDIQVEFSYAGTATGFRLYQNDVQVCEATNGAARVMDCTGITMGYDDEWTLTAVDATAMEGAASVTHKFGRLKGEYKRLRGGGFAGGSM